MNNKSLSDAVLLLMLRGSVEDRKKALEVIYKDSSLRRKIIAFVKSKGGGEEDAKDVLHETLIIFNKNIQNDQYKNNGSLRNYFFGIAKLYWLASKRILLKEKIERTADNPINDKQENVSDVIILLEKKKALNLVIAQLGERCQKILTLWGHDESMEKIAEVMGFQDKNAAKKEAYRCRERIKKYLEEHPTLKEILEF